MSKFLQRTLALPILLCAIACMTTPACDSATTGGPAPDTALTAQENDILDALEAMRARGEHATLHVTDADGTPLLKLSSDGNDIVANLPLDWVTDAQLTAARTAFADAGAGGDQLPARNTADLFPELDVTLGNDPERAARFVATLLEEVYALPPQEELVFETEDD